MKPWLRELIRLQLSGVWLGFPLGLLSLIGFLSRDPSQAYFWVLLAAIILSLPWGIPFLLLMVFAAFAQETPFDLAFNLFLLMGFLVVMCINLNGGLIYTFINSVISYDNDTS
jgi:hypothetical protein